LPRSQSLFQSVRLPARCNSAERPMSDECIELDRADSGIVARSSAIIGESEHDTSEDAVRKSLSLFWGLNDPHKFWAKIGVGRSTSGYAKKSEVFVQGADADSIFYLQEGRAIAKFPPARFLNCITWTFRSVQMCT
jgi:hypothetical protein